MNSNNEKHTKLESTQVKRWYCENLSWKRLFMFELMKYDQPDEISAS